MVYDITLTVKDKGEIKNKQFYLSADNKKELYKRVLNTYGIAADNVTINQEIRDEDIDVNINKKKPVTTNKENNDNGNDNDTKVPTTTRKRRKRSK